MFRIHPDMVDEIVIVDTGSTDRTKERNLRIYEKLLSTGKQFAPRDLQHYARELHHHKLYEKAIEYYLKFMDLDDASAEDMIFVCGKLADCYYQLGNKEKELAFTFKSFEYDIPRPDFCCRLGFHFLQKNEFHQAVFWYKLAADSPQPENRWTTVNYPSRTWLPHIQLGLCFYQLGEYQLSYEHNKIALTYRSNDEQILNNLTLLEELIHRSRTNIKQC